MVRPFFVAGSRLAAGIIGSESQAIVIVPEDSCDPSRRDLGLVDSIDQMREQKEPPGGGLNQGTGNKRFVTSAIDFVMENLCLGPLEETTDVYR